MIRKLIFLFISIFFIKINLILGGIISSSSIESCVLDGTQLAQQDKTNLKCDKKLVVSLYIDSQKENTETFNFQINEIKDENGKIKTLVMPISISFKKSETFINYPLVYLQNVAYQPKETVIYKTDYLVTSGCKDSPSDHTCPGATDINGELIRDSQGFCCSCSMSDYIGADQNSRANLGCSLLGSQSSSAHCLSFSPMKYDVYNIAKTQVEYKITATLTYSYNQNPITQDIILSNSNPMGMDSFSQAIIRIVGDFQSSTQINQFTDKKVVFPYNQPNSINTAMLLDQNFFDLSGLTCNKIGVSYSAFQNQPNKCAALFGSCLQNQISDYYNADVTLISNGKKGNYIASQFGTKVQVAGDQNSRSLKNRFDESHRTMLTITLKADSLQYRVNISPGKIISYQIDRFESMSKNGILRVKVQNIGTINSDYTLAIVNCSGDINPIDSKDVTIKSKEIYSFEFQIFTTSKLDSTYQCFGDLYNEVAQVIHSIRINFNTSETMIDNGPQSGENSLDGDSLNIGSQFTCDDVCPNLLNVVCYYDQLKICTTKFALFLTVLVVIVIAIILCFKLPIIRNFLKLIFCCGCSCFKNKKKKSSSRKNKSQKKDDSDSGSSESDESDKVKKNKIKNHNSSIKMKGLTN
ncbi:hypothetical protein ACTFIW_011523 [Dictyostelium discoideum]